MRRVRIVMRGAITSHQCPDELSGCYACPPDLVMDGVQSYGQWHGTRLYKYTSIDSSKSRYSICSVNSIFKWVSRDSNMRGISNKWTKRMIYDDEYDVHLYE